MEKKLIRPTLIVAALAVLVLLLGLAAFFAYRNRPAILTLEVAGTKGRRFLGHCYVDGVKRNISGTIPDTLTFQGRRLEFTVVVADDQSVADMKFTVNVNGRPSGYCGGARGIKGGFSKTMWSSGNWMGTVADPECKQVVEFYRTSRRKQTSGGVSSK